MRSGDVGPQRKLGRAHSTARRRTEHRDEAAVCEVVGAARAPPRSKDVVLLHTYTAEKDGAQPLPDGSSRDFFPCHALGAPRAI